MLIILEIPDDDTEFQDIVAQQMEDRSYSFRKDTLCRTFHERDLQDHYDMTMAAG